MAKEKVSATSLFDSMQKLQAPNTSTKPAVAEKVSGDNKINNKNDIESKTEPPVEVKSTPSKSQESSSKEEYSSIIYSIEGSVKKKKSKSIHKSFLITEELNDKLRDTSCRLGISENELINIILTKVL